MQERKCGVSEQTLASVVLTLVSTQLSFSFTLKAQVGIVSKLIKGLHV